MIVCGGRSFNNRAQMTFLLARACERLGWRNLCVVHGGQRGADKLAADIAEKWGWKVEAHPPNTKRYGSPHAFHVRNQEMVDAGAELVVAAPGGNGTANLIERAEKAHIPILRAEPVHA